MASADRDNPQMRISRVWEAREPGETSAMGIDIVTRDVKGDSTRNAVQAGMEPSEKTVEKETEKDAMAGIGIARMIHRQSGGVTGTGGTGAAAESVGDMMTMNDEVMTEIGGGKGMTKGRSTATATDAGMGMTVIETGTGGDDSSLCHALADCTLHRIMTLMILSHFHFMMMLVSYSVRL